MKQPPRPCPGAPGNVAAGMAMVGGALAMSALLFFLVTRHFLPSAAPEDPPAESSHLVVHAPQPGSDKPAMLPAESTTPPMPKPEPATPQPSPTPAPGPKPPPMVFRRPLDLGAEFVRRLVNDDLQGAACLLSCEHSMKELAAKATMEKIFHSMGYRPAPAEELEVLGQMENTVRLALPLRAKGAKREDLRLLLDLEPDEKLGWKVTRLHLPQELEAALAVPAQSPTPAPPQPQLEGHVPPASLSMATPLPKTPEPTPSVLASGAKIFITVDSHPDALTFAGDFVHLLVALKYDKVRPLVDEAKVPPVKLAALCIVLEDGHFQLLESRPLEATVANETSSWVVARLHSTPLHEDTEFGLELEQTEGHWHISGLNLSKLLEDTTKATEATEGVPFTPMVMDPKGGESIALYFEYDSDVLTARASKQLDLVAAVLKTSGHRKLKIGGHTDAKGSDNYNVSLSRRRAEAVKRYILSQGVPTEQVETVAFGKADPLSPNRHPDGTDNPEGRSHNRRAQILLDF